MPSQPDQTCGWQSDLPKFRETTPKVICGHLEEFIRDASAQEIRSWMNSIPLLQREAAELLEAQKHADQYTAILEYRLPMESRRPDVVVLLMGPVVVVELKGKERPSQADLDQVSAYVRDLRSYHRECADRPVHAVLVPTRMKGDMELRENVRIIGPAGLDGLLAEFSSPIPQGRLTASAFLSEDAYRPLPTLIQAARELLNGRSIRQIWRATSDTDKALSVVTRIAHEAASTRTRHLVLITGVPGSGKTLVGLRLVHSPFLDDLVVERQGIRPTVPAVFLSGNGPLVLVLQYLLRSAGGGGRAFVRGVRDYLDTYAPRPNRIPPEHIIVFDEAQRAFDPTAVKKAHKEWPAALRELSEPAHFIRIAERIPEWCVVVGLIGEGQEIHVGEEAGIGQWKEAIEKTGNPKQWTIHAPERATKKFKGGQLRVNEETQLNLDTEIRFHLAKKLHDWVARVLDGNYGDEVRQIAGGLNDAGYRLFVTRELAKAKQYVTERYEENSDARFGLLASSKDKDLESFEVHNGYQDTKRVKLGAWYGAEGEQSCRSLKTVVTEFGAQGLELDFTVLCWGTDLRRKANEWTNEEARGYRKPEEVKDPMQLRKNAYRVLLTRGRDGTAVFIPPLTRLDETYDFLLKCGCKELRDP